ncbi:MAG: DUF4236 domain-containing protein [Xanthobacteraceae bacterium]
MPLRFYRRFRAGPFRMNLSKSGVSWSVGHKGAWLTTGHGRQRVSIGIPGTGLGWYEQRRLPRSTSAPAPMLSIVSTLAIVAVLAGVALAILWH